MNNQKECKHCGLLKSTVLATGGLCSSPSTISDRPHDFDEANDHTSSKEKECCLKCLSFGKWPYDTGNDTPYCMWEACPCHIPNQIAEEEPNPHRDRILAEFSSHACPAFLGKCSHCKTSEWLATVLDDYGKMMYETGQQYGDWWGERLEDVLESGKRQGYKAGAREERQFFLNILDGIDEADRQLGNLTPQIKALRHALRSRIV